MTEETAKLLIEATNRLASAIERATGGLGAAGGGINIYHHSVPQLGHQPYFVPPMNWGGTCGGHG